MDPHNGREPREHSAQEHPAEAPTPALGSPQIVPSDGPVRTVRLIAGDHLLTVNPLDGSEIEPTPPGEGPGRPERYTPQERADRARASAPPVPPGGLGHPVDQLPLLERAEEIDRLARLLSRGRSVRLTGPSGSGRSRLLDAVATACADLAPDGVVRLSGYRRTPTDVLHDLFAAVHRAPQYRPGRPELLAAVAEIGAVVVLDDLEFGGEALEELLAVTPECAFLISATPDVPAPSAASHIEEIFVGGIGREACQELLARAAGRPLTEEERAWAGDLWFESEGLPLRFLQAGAVLRQRDRLREDPAAADAYGRYTRQPYEAPLAAGDDHGAPLPGIAEAASFAALIADGLGPAAQEALRLAVALGGDLPHPAHLPALLKDPVADAALGDLLACGLISPAGTHYRLAANVLDQLTAAGYADGAAGRAHAAAQHYSWWAGHASVPPERAAAEADALLAAMAQLTSGREPGHASAAVLLARTAAPAFAAALQWSAWERSLRHGQEAARIAGEVAEEAYFHHELGVLALCTGNLDRARAELEASIGLRGALADRRGAVAGRRALALVADRTGATTVPTDVTSAAAGEEIHGAGTDQSEPPPGSATLVGSLPREADETAPTVLTPAATAAAGPKAAGSGAKRTVFSGTRRNLVAAGAGALLAAVLGTIVTLGATSGTDTGPADKVKSGQSAEEGSDSGGLTADAPTGGTTDSPRSAGSSAGPESQSADASSSASPGDPATGDKPGASESAGTSQRPTEPSEEPSESSGKPTQKPTQKPTPPKPTPTTEEPTPSDPEPTTAEPSDPSESPSTTASGPATGGPTTTESATTEETSA